MIFPSNILAAVPAILLIHFPSVSALPAKHSRSGNEVSNLSTSTSMTSPEPNSIAWALDRRSPFYEPLQKTVIKVIEERAEKRAKAEAARRPTAAQKKQQRDEYDRYMAEQQAKYDAAAALPHDPPKRRYTLHNAKKKPQGSPPPAAQKPQGRPPPAAQKPKSKSRGIVWQAPRRGHTIPVYAMSMGQMEFDVGTDDDSDE